MNLRTYATAVGLPGLAGLAALAAIVLPNGDQLSWLRFAIGMATYVAIHIAGSALAGLWLRRRAAP